MKKITLTGITLAFCALFLTSCSKEPIDSELTSYDQVVTERAEYDYSNIEVEILDEINIYRKALGLSEFRAMAELSIESEDHNEYMIEEGVVSHDNFSSKGF